MSHQDTLRRGNEVNAALLKWCRIRLPGFTLLIVLVAGAMRDAALLYRHNIAVGVDGYYYVVQVSHVLQRGQLYYPTYSRLFIYVAAGVTKITRDPIPTVKGLNLLFHAALVIGVFTLVTFQTASKWLGLMSAALCQSSSLHLYLVSEFNSNLCGLTFVVWAAVLLSIGLSAQLRKGYILFAFVLMSLAILSHISSAPLLAVLTLCAVAAYWIYLGRSHATLCALILLSAAWLAPLGLALLPSRYFSTRLEHTFLAYPVWPIETIAVPERWFLLVAAPLILIFLPYRPQFHGARLVLLLGSCSLFSVLVLLNPFLDFGAASANLPGRLGVLSYILASLLAAGLAHLIFEITSRRAPNRGRLGLTLLVACSMVVCGVAWARSTPPSGLSDKYLGRTEDLIANLRAHRSEIGDKALVLARQGDDFVVTDTLMLPSQWELPAAPQVGSRRMLWLLDHFPNDMLDRDVVPLSFGKGGATVLVPHQTLIRYLRSAPPRDVIALEAHNLHLYRATHLRSGMPSDSLQ